MKILRYSLDVLIIICIIMAIAFYYDYTYSLPKMISTIDDTVEIEAEIDDYWDFRSGRGISQIGFSFKNYEKDFLVYDVDEFNLGVFLKEYKNDSDSLCFLIVTRESLDNDKCVDILAMSINGKECITLEQTKKSLKIDKIADIGLIGFNIVMIIVLTLLRIIFNKFLHEGDNDIYIYSR